MTRRTARRNSDRLVSGNSEGYSQDTSNETSWIAACEGKDGLQAMTEVFVYGLVALAMLMLWLLGTMRRAKGLSPSRQLSSSDVAHAIRRVQRPK